LRVSLASSLAACAMHRECARYCYGLSFFQLHIEGCCHHRLLYSGSNCSNANLQLHKARFNAISGPLTMLTWHNNNPIFRVYQVH